MQEIPVSIVIPTYNRSHYLKRAIDSIRNQTHPHWELIIVDDGSTDNSCTIVKSYNDERIKLLTRTFNLGVSSARNWGIKMAQYEWVALLDSDDEWLPQKLEKQLDYVQLHPQIYFVHCDEIWIRHDKRVNPHKKHQKHGGRIYSYCLPLCCVSPSASLLHKKILHDVGLFNEDYPVCEDYDLWLRIFSRYDAGYIDRPLLKKYGGHQDQLSHRFFAMDYWRVKSLTQILKNHQQYLSQDEIDLTKVTLHKKAQILINGYEKHKNYKHLEHIKNLLSQNL
ncbi:MAG: glycosyltransferase [Bdellovibrionales bacterium]|nr:glycosyltransferase [Bdellovibrionales bacterium]